MKKTPITLLMLALLHGPVFAESANISGFADITYTNDNDLSVFKANAEVDISNKLSDTVSVHVDTDLAITNNENATVDGPGDSATIEQAYFALSTPQGVTILGGVFNNPIGWETEDAPGLYQISHGQIWGILDQQTALYGNNIAGVAGAFAVGPVNITAGVLNDIGHNDLETNSLALVLNASPIAGLDLEAGYVTQEKGPTSAENVLDINATYKFQGLTAGLEYLQADKIVDSAIGVTANYQINKMFGGTVRYDVVSYEASGTDDTSKVTVAGTFQAAKNLLVLAEYSSFDDGNNTDDIGMLEFVANF